ncbi:MoxR-like ATPase [Pseudomonas fluvialis]|uniref:MoxR-like ATPase n=1 Tax=Pseudomonas fluvialis TaxID=1793966 RepID=A0A7X0EU60_9PSED|nr:AAA family ATPase [Pseudomonas fluvialis]MBB6341256.1 MoxR-like ATPase [Pseudomonas fluvialis]
MSESSKKVQRVPAEVRFAEELRRLAETDSHEVPPGWRLSPIAVERFIDGAPELGIARKFVGESGQLRRTIISLCANRSCLLTGEPGTAKSWLSELLAAAICGNSTLTIQGNAISSLQQMLYSWNPGVLAQHGPCPEALVPGPLYRAMQTGQLLRFEELTRCPLSLQDSLLAVLSERIILIPELAGEHGILYARPGFNLIATSNNVDEGIHSMSAALKRRLSFETIRPIARIEDEIGVVQTELRQLNSNLGLNIEPDADIIEVLVTLFHELRSGQSLDGRSTHRMAGAALSTAEAIHVAHAMCVHAHYYSNDQMRAEDLVHFIIGTALKDKPEDRRRLKYYFDSEISQRQDAKWQQVYAQRHLL